MVPPLLALIAWPLVSIAFFKTLRLPLAIMLTILGGFLFLPENTALAPPGLPDLDKASLPALTALVLALVFADKTAPDGAPSGLVPRRPGILFLLSALCVGAVLTALSNSDALVYGSTVLPGMQIYDAVSVIADTFIMALPLFLARRFLADPDAQRLLLQVLCIAALGYSLLVLFEVRMSPQLNQWVYGFFPHSWLQHVRAGGFRPVVFLQHGLVVGIFLCMATLATVALVRIGAGRRMPFLLAAIWLLATLVLSRNLGALLIAAALLPVIFFLGVRGQLLAAAIISGMFLIYPAARSSQILPFGHMVQLAEDIDPDRAGSFVFRLENEERLLAKASQRPLFGWGGWGRPRVYNTAGDDISVTDGSWIITIGASGWVGYLAQYGLLTLPVFLLLLRRRLNRVGMETSALAVILAANLMDLVPNASNTPLTWLLAGALWGRLEWQHAASRSEAADPHPRPRAAYARTSAPAEVPPTGLPALPPLKNPYTRQTTRMVRAKAAVKPASR